MIEKVREETNYWLGRLFLGVWTVLQIVGTLALAAAGLSGFLARDPVVSSILGISAGVVGLCAGIIIQQIGTAVFDLVDARLTGLTRSKPDPAPAREIVPPEDHLRTILASRRS